MGIVTDPEPFSEQQPEPAAANADTGTAGSVTGQWVEVYPPGESPADGESAPEPADDVDRTPGNGAGAFATVLFGVSVIMIVVGSFMPLFQASMTLETAPSADSTILSMDAWHLTFGDSVSGAPLATHVEPAPVPLGYPLLVASLLLAIVVLLRLRALRRPAGQRLANALGVAAAAYLAGLAFAIGTFEVAWRGLSSSAAIGPVQELIGSGYWLLVVSALVSIGAVIAAYRRPAEPLPDSVGMAIVERQQPLVPPGQPAEWPVVAVIPSDERTNW